MPVPKQQFPTKFSGDYRQLDANEQMRVRNEIIITDYLCGINAKEIAERVKLTKERVNEIITQRQKDALEWHQNLMKDKIVMVHNFVSMKVMDEIRRMRRIRNGIKNDPEAEFAITKSIMDAYIKYDEMLASGVVFDEVRRLTGQVKKVMSI